MIEETITEKTEKQTQAEKVQPFRISLPKLKHTKTRAGFTKNHGQGQSKVRRLMTKRSRRLNRGK